MQPLSKLELFWIKLKCFFGFHDWVQDMASVDEDEYCWNCGKTRKEK